MFNILIMLVIGLKVSVNNNLKRISSRFGYGTSFIHYYIVVCHDWFYCRFQFFPQIKYQTRKFVHAALFLIPYANMHPHITWFRFSLGLNFNPKPKRIRIYVSTYFLLCPFSYSLILSLLPTLTCKTRTRAQYNIFS